MLLEMLNALQELFQAVYLVHPIAFSLGGLTVYWYGIAYAAGMALGLAFLNYFFDFEESSFSPSNLLLFIIIGVVVGGKLGNFFFYDSSIETLWSRSGMSFHGGFLGACAACLCASVVYRMSFLRITDAVSLVAPIGIFFGRLANAVNQEILGRTTDSIFAVICDRIDIFYRHPVSIYEAVLEGLLLFMLLLILHFHMRSNKKDGIITAAFVMFYSVARFFCEAFKNDSIEVWNWEGIVFKMTMGQALSILMFLVGLGLLMCLLFQFRSRKAVR